MKTSLLASAAACVASALLASSASAYNTYTVTFQQGANGYASETDMQFTSNYGTGSHAADGDKLGVTGKQLYSDGYNGTDSGDQQLFLKFDDLIGSGPGQIPANAFVMDASLALTTYYNTSTAANSGGPFGVGAVLVPWSASSTYNTLKPAGSPENGLDAAHGAITPAVGFYDDPAVLYNGDNNLDWAKTYTANVAPLVRSWANGAIPNYGFTLHAGAPAATTNAWEVDTSTYGTVATRPKLSVTYTNAPAQTASFQQGVNGYNSTDMAWLRLQGDYTQDGSTIHDDDYLDGFQTAAEQDEVSSDDHALIRFNKIFASDGGSIPEHAVIVKATLVLTTATASNAQTGQPYQAHQMLRGWNSSTTWTDFDSDYGIRIGTDESQMLSAQYGMIPQSQAQFDITQAVINWENGDPNYGIDVRATPPNPLDPAWSVQNGTSDGWDIYFTGANDPTLRPQLLVSYFLHLPGDANDNGKIDADDFALTDRGFAMQSATPQWFDGDFDYNGTVDSADYLILDQAYAQQIGTLSPSFLAMREAQFGPAYVSSLLASVPEPTTLGLAAASLLTLRRRRRPSIA